MRYTISRITLSLILLVATSYARADDVLLLVDEAPADGLLVARVDLTGAARWCKVDSVAPGGIRALTVPDDQAVPFQFVPRADYDPQKRLTGTVILRLPEGSDGRLKLEFGPAEDAPAEPWDGSLTTPAFVVKHDAEKLGGLPSSITFSNTGKVFEGFRWNDRVYDREKGWFGLANDPQPSVELVSRGPLCTVVRVRARYMKSPGEAPPSKPEAVYDWHYFHDQPLVFVCAAMSQQEPCAWPEHHFLELNYPREAFPRWAGGEPLKQGEFTVTNKSFGFPQWGALVHRENAIAMFDCGQALFYDAGGGTYLHAHGNAAWAGWHDTKRRLSAWLWIGSDASPVAAIQAAASELPTSARITVTADEVRTRIQAARKELEPLEGRDRAQAWWRAFGAAQLEAEGRLEEAAQTAAGQMPASWSVLTGGELGMILDRTAHGMHLVSLSDVRTGRQLLGPEPLPLFTLTLRNAETKEEVRLDADAAWNEVDVVLPAWEGMIIRWRQPEDDRLGPLSVEASVRPDHRANALCWGLKVENPSDAWSVWRVVFPQVAVADLGPEASVFFPRGAGEVQQGVWQRSFRFGGTYPSGWTSMQFLAAYNGDRTAGLYVATHDPLGSTKDIRAESRPADPAVVLSFDHPAPDMGVAGNGFELGGPAVWQLLRGDWFDAAVTYRAWARNEAVWFPKLSSEGREDTPPWMRELSCWALGGGSPGGCVAAVKEFAAFLGVPVGFHWYNWHQIPFDNDYPHYFPTKEGFAEGVRELQEANVYVMPYINGRLWDTRDKGMDDFEFSNVARPAATKDENGEPCTEVYGSKESDGSPVRLAAMCPTTDVWRHKVREIVLRLMNECGVKGVYIDQVAAARPRLCFDKSHGHPLGGGHWWTEAYWALLDGIHQAMPDDRMLTTECNAEPYAHRFDGYLTWHWQYDGQVPAFPAVYGGAIQMFGRAYRGGPTKDLALRMKAGQQLVFGEQIGWIDPGVIREKENAEFLRAVVRLRHYLRRYFYAGEMARPPKLTGEIPRVTADWQWSGEWPVTTDAVMTGAWTLPAEKRLVLLFVNVGDEPVSARLDLDAREYGLPDSQVRVHKMTAEAVVSTEDTAEAFTTPPAFQGELTFPPRTGWAWEFTAE